MQTGDLECYSDPLPNSQITNLQLIHYYLVTDKGLTALLSSNATSLVMGRCNSVPRARTLALLTIPSLAVSTCKTRPKGHSPRGLEPSTNRTKSPTERPGWDRLHFCLCCNSGRYSSNQRAHIIVISACTCFHRLRAKVIESAPAHSQS